MNWKTTTLLLCTYGFMKEFRPSEPYLYEYEHVTLNISEHTLNSEVYPIWTYSYMIALIPVFLLTDLFLYKPVIIIEALSYICVWILFVFFGSVLVQQIIEVFYGCATATEVAYFAYIYVKVSRENYKRVTSYTRAALQVGRFVAYLVGQMIILLHGGTYRTLNIISLSSLCVSLVVACLLPMVSWKNAYEKRLEGRGTILTTNQRKEASYREFVKLHLRSVYVDVKTIYGDLFVTKWSMWWAFASCANFQIGNYMQTLWGTVIDVKNANVYNGFTEAACPLIAIPVVLLMQRVRINWPRWGEICLTVCSLFDGAILLLLSKTNNLFVMYAGYVVYRVLYQGMITIAQFNIAERLGSDSFGLVFGLNTFVALVMQSILTLIVVDERGLGMSIRPQFVVYSCYHFAVAVIFAVPVVHSLVSHISQRCRSSTKSKSITEALSTD